MTLLLSSSSFVSVYLLRFVFKYQFYLFFMPEPDEDLFRPQFLPVKCSSDTGQVLFCPYLRPNQNAHFRVPKANLKRVICKLFTKNKPGKRTAGAPPPVHRHEQVVLCGRCQLGGRDLGVVSHRPCQPSSQRQTSPPSSAAPPSPACNHIIICDLLFIFVICHILVIYFCYLSFIYLLLILL